MILTEHTRVCRSRAAKSTSISETSGDETKESVSDSEQEEEDEDEAFKRFPYRDPLTRWLLPNVELDFPRWLIMQAGYACFAVTTAILFIDSAPLSVLEPFRRDKLPDRNIATRI